MENLASIVEKIVKTTDEGNQENVNQLSKFKETVKKLAEFETLEKPSYSLPLVDTLGKETYTILNKRK